MSAGSFLCKAAKWHIRICAPMIAWTLAMMDFLPDLPSLRADMDKTLMATLNVRVLRCAACTLFVQPIIEIVLPHCNAKLSRLWRVVCGLERPLFLVLFSFFSRLTAMRQPHTRAQSGKHALVVSVSPGTRGLPRKKHTEHEGGA